MGQKAERRGKPDSGGRKEGGQLIRHADRSHVLAGAFRYCRWFTRQANSHFALSFRWLPTPQRQAMEAVYAFCRAVDDAVDREGATETGSRDELGRWRQELSAMEQGSPAHPIAVALQAVCAEHRIPRAFLEKLIAGVEMDLKPRRYRTFEELRIYCEHVASVVGLISVRVFGCRHPSADRYATDLGIALQITNILRDLKSDADKGRIYLPLEDLERFGVTETQLLHATSPEAFRELMVFQCGRAKQFFRSAEEALAESGEARQMLPARIMGAVYRRLLRRIEERQYDVFSGRIRIAPLEQVWVAAGCLAR